MLTLLVSFFASAFEPQNLSSWAEAIATFAVVFLSVYKRKHLEVQFYKLSTKKQIDVFPELKTVNLYCLSVLNIHHRSDSIKFDKVIDSYKGHNKLFRPESIAQYYQNATFGAKWIIHDSDVLQDIKSICAGSKGHELTFYFEDYWYDYTFYFPKNILKRKRKQLRWIHAMTHWDIAKWLKKYYKSLFLAVSIIIAFVLLNIDIFEPNYGVIMITLSLLLILLCAIIFIYKWRKKVKPKMHFADLNFNDKHKALIKYLAIVFQFLIRIIFFMNIELLGIIGISGHKISLMDIHTYYAMFLFDALVIVIYGSLIIAEDKINQMLAK